MTQIATAPTTISTGPAPGTPTAAGTTTSAAERRATARRHFFTGTPGRMRILAVVASLACLGFALSGFFALRALDSSVNRAAANTEQVVRVQQIYADLLRADAATTNGFLQGGLEPVDLRSTYDSAMARVSRNIAEAANAQPADGEALSLLNERLGTYVTYVNQARTYNRQVLPVGAQYLTLASDQLRTDILPIVDNLRAANQDRAQTELGAGKVAALALGMGVLTLGLLGLIGWWLAQKTHRILSLPLAAAFALVAGGVGLTLTMMASTASTMSTVRDGDFSSAVNLASARAAAYDAKSNEALTLVKRGSGAANQAAYEKALATALDAVDKAGFGPGKSPGLAARLGTYSTLHDAIRKADDSGDWDKAVALATSTKSGSANAAFDEFDAASEGKLKDKASSAIAALDGLQRPLFPWLVGLAGILAALAAARSMTPRIEEYR